MEGEVGALSVPALDSHFAFFALSAPVIDSFFQVRIAYRDGKSIATLQLRKRSGFLLLKSTISLPEQASRQKERTFVFDPITGRSRALWLSFLSIHLLVQELLNMPFCLSKHHSCHLYVDSTSFVLDLWKGDRLCSKGIPLNKYVLYSVLSPCPII